MVRQYVGAANFVKNLLKGTQKTTGTGAINTTNISKNLKEFQKHKEDIIKSTDKYGKGLSEEGKIQVTTVSQSEIANDPNINLSPKYWIDKKNDSK